MASNTLSAGIRHTPGERVYHVFKYVVCIFLAVLSIFPFLIMAVNATRTTTQIQAHPISLLFGTNFLKNLDILLSKNMFNPLVGLRNSFIISAGATILTVYFSTLTAYALVAYEWKLRALFFTSDR